MVTNIHSHRHSKAECLKILRNLSTYLDGELASDVCDEIRAHLGACPNCELFVNSLRQTVSLCRHIGTRPLSPRIKARIHREILKTVGRA
jgi:anti-sigma factor RsiW